MPCTASVHLLVIQAIGYVYTNIFVLTAIVCVLHAKASYLSAISEENPMLFFIYYEIFNYETVMIFKICAYDVSIYLYVILHVEVEPKNQSKCSFL
jgi:hypothetical protein